MIVDKYDGCLVMEENDLQCTLSEFKNNRSTPEYIERGILKFIFHKNNIPYNSECSFEDLLTCLPDEVLNNITTGVKAMFFSGNKIDYKSFHDSYLFYYLEANIFKIWKPMLDLQLNNLLKKDLVILDIGTGPGSIPVGVIEFYKLLSVKYPEIHFSIVIDIIEAEYKFLEIAEYMISEVISLTTPNLKVNLRKRVHQILDDEFDYSGMDTYDLITMSNFLTVNERDNVKRGASILAQLSGILKDDGSIIVIEPGDLVNGKMLKNIRNEITNSSNMNVYSPCSGVWEKKKNFSCNCYSPTRTYWETPRLHRFLYQKGINKAGREQLPFQYVVYRLDGLTKYYVVRNKQHYIQLKDLSKHINEKVNVKANIRSVIERRKSNQWAVLLCDGSCIFDKRDSEIKAVMQKTFLIEMGLIFPVITGERLTLKNVRVKSTKYGLELKISKDSKIDIEY
ncbi:hypothetical protein [Vallitalea guaymasensis]|uniref:hypothetical protein n=1 Tax=Vallitalea guaymasensis TaxID=1185412 RepID=UPI000DE285B7|nr:hypothetical protein [Vallitalea guaymasensis]